MSIFRHWTWRRSRPCAGLLGKAPATDYGAANVTLKMVQASELPTPPARFGHATMFRDWKMLGNDTVGDCAFAGSAHEHMAWTGIGNHGTLSAAFTTKGVLSDYSALTGYRPGVPSTDQGTNVSQMMDYRRTTGLVDSVSERHKIDLAVRLDPVGGPFDWDQFLRAIWAFKAVGVGTLMPSSAMRQFNAGQPWDYVGDHNIEGGHYIPALGSPNTNEVAVITWGQRQLMTRSFFENYVDELWVILSREATPSIELALSSLDWDSVERIARSLGQADA